MNNYSHLLPETQELLGKTLDEKIEFIKREKFIMYPKAQEILERLEELLKEPSRNRMPNFLVVGDSNNGKTSILWKFYRQHPTRDTLGDCAIPIMFIQAPPVPDESRLYDEFLKTLMVPFKQKDTVSAKEALVVRYLSRLQTQIIVIDEIHNILGGSIQKQRAFMNAIKNMSNKLSIPIVLVGTKDALRATNTDMQISSRFKPVFIPKWKIDHDYISLLSSIEQLLPFEQPSRLASKELALKIFEKSEGYIGEIIDYINQAAILALKGDSKKITVDNLSKCNYVAPSMRRTYTELEYL